MTQEDIAFSVFALGLIFVPLSIGYMIGRARAHYVYTKNVRKIVDEETKDKLEDIWQYLNELLEK